MGAVAVGFVEVHVNLLPLLVFRQHVDVLEVLVVLVAVDFLWLRPQVDARDRLVSVPYLLGERPRVAHFVWYFRTQPSGVEAVVVLQVVVLATSILL